MKHLPNLLTLANLLCGCMAIAFLVSQPFLTEGNQYWFIGTEQSYWASVLIITAAIFDMLDGFAARALNVFSPIGKDLDSLADVVSFGVAPSMILFKMLWASYMADENALDVSMWAMLPAFLIACFGALRLARYNVTTDTQKSSFIGMPIPAVGLLIATFPLIDWYSSGIAGNKPNQMGIYIIGLLRNKWVLYLLIGMLSWFMVSKIRFFKLLPSSFRIANTWPQIVLILGTLVAIPALKFAAALVTFILYVILSFVYKPKEA